MGWHAGAGRVLLACVLTASAVLASACAGTPASSVPPPLVSLAPSVTASAGPGGFAEEVPSALPPLVYSLVGLDAALVADNRLAPTSASRVFAFTLLAASRAYRAAPDGQRDAAAAYAAAAVGNAIFTGNRGAAAEFDALTRAYRGLSPQVAEVAGTVAADVAAMAADGYADAILPDAELPVASAWDWEPTGASRTSFETPHWRDLPTIADTSACTLPYPDVSVLESEGHQMLVEYSPAAAAGPTVLRWLGGPGSATPPGMWMSMAAGAARAGKLPADKATDFLAGVAVAEYDAGILVWREKFRHHVARPETMWARWGHPVTLIRETPPHPSYPSGHSGFSGAGAQLITDVLGSTPVTLNLPADNGVDAESIAYPDAWAAANEASQSRVLAAFHYPTDGRAGLQLGSCAAKAAEAFMAGEGS